MSDQDPKIRISNSEGVFMVLVALAWDALAWLAPVVGGAIALVFGTGTFAMWFNSRGVGFISPKKAASGLANLFGEVGTGGLWLGFTVGVILMLVIVRAEDKTGISVPTPGIKAAGVKSQIKKSRRRMAQSPEHRAAVRARAVRIREIRRKRVNSSKPNIQGIRPAPSKA